MALKRSFLLTAISSPPRASHEAISKGLTDP
eukprot:COSAG06_NODE_2489_length_6771_cov_4.361661_2_plen_30_part_01